jgi:putative tryptophan/tyrosine transport system substrate-binding protein
MSQISRRNLLLAASAVLAAPHIGFARKRLPVLGVLAPGRKPPRNDPTHLLFMQHLRELGWVDGKTLRIERAYCGDDLGRLPELADILAAKRVDVIWTASPQGAVAAARATTTIPIVFWRVGFPVELGLVDKLARPGRNVTGLAWFANEGIYVKRYQLLRELAPHVDRVGTIYAPNTMYDVSGHPLDLKWLRDKITAGTQAMGLQRRVFLIRRLADFRPVFDAIERWRADSLMVHDVPLTILARRRIVDFARRRRLVDVYYAREWAEAGGLMSYGIVFVPTLVRSLDMVDRILRGANPANMPVELPSEYELVVNLRTAKAQDFEVPQSILLRADRVIQ